MSVLGDRLPTGRLDVTVAIAALVVALALVPLRFLSSEVYIGTIPPVVAVASGLYLLSVRRAATTGRPGWTVGASGVALAELVGIGLAATVALAAVDGTRSVRVLLLAAGVGALILLQIAFLSEAALDGRLVLLQILAHAAVVRFTGLWTTPSFIGVDNWTHIVEYATPVMEVGSLAPMAGVKYILAPFHHLSTVVGAQLLGVSLRTALYAVVGGTVVLALLLVFGTARHFVGTRWALLATATFAMADQAIRWGLHVIPTSLGLVFFLGVVYVVARLLHVETGPADWALLAICIVAVTFTHQLSAFVSLVFLGSGVLAQVLVGHVDRLTPVTGRSVTGGGSTGTEESGPIADGGSVRGVVPLHGAFAFHLVFTGGVWAITPWRGEPFIARATQLFWLTVQNSAGFLNLVESGGGGGGGAAETGASLGWLAAYVDATGFLVLLFVTVIGSLALVRRHRSPQAAHTLVVAIGVMLVFAFVLPLFGIRNFLPGRWYAFAYALMAVVGVAGLAHLGRRFPSKAVAALLVVLLLAYPFAMVTAQKATLDDPTFEDEWPRYAYSESELAAVETIGEATPDDAAALFTDHPYRTAFSGSGAHPASAINFSRADGGGDLPYRRTVYRRYQSTAAPQFLDSGVVVTRQVSRDRLCPPTRNHVYANRGIRLCTRPDV